MKETNVTNTHGCIVRALWGDHKLRNFYEVLDEVKWCLSQPIQPEPTRWYVYGQENFDYLVSLGLSPELLSSRPFVAFERASNPENPDVDNIVRHGVSMWRMKYPAIRHALESNEAVVWMDLDTILMEPLPVDFWDRMALGQPFQCTLQQNFKRRAGWRAEDNEPRKTPGGNWMYFRGLDTIDQTLRLYEEHPNEWDLTVLARLTDEMMGGTFLGSEAYRDLGYEPYCHSLGHREGRQVHKPEQTIFMTHWRKSRLTKLRKRARA